MNVHQNARMTMQGRLLVVTRVRRAGWRVGDAAAAAGISQRTAYKWLARDRAGGEGALHHRSSAPARCPCRLAADVEAEIERLHRQRWSGPRIARARGLPVSTVGAVLRRLGLGRLRALEVLSLLLEGRSNKSIAHRLGLKHATVAFHLKSVFRKLNVASRTEAVSAAVKLGLSGR